MRLEVNASLHPFTDGTRGRFVILACAKIANLPFKRAGGTARHTNRAVITLIKVARRTRAHRQGCTTLIRLSVEAGPPQDALRCSTPAEAQRTPSSCSPPPAEASDCATLWVAKIRSDSLPSVSRPKNSLRPVSAYTALLSLRRLFPSPAGISSRFCCRKMIEIPL